MTLPRYARVHRIVRGREVHCFLVVQRSSRCDRIQTARRGKRSATIVTPNSGRHFLRSCALHQRRRAHCPLPHFLNQFVCARCRRWRLVRGAICHVWKGMWEKSFVVFGVCSRPGVKSQSQKFVGVRSCAADSSSGQSREFSFYLQFCQEIFVWRLTARGGPSSRCV